VVLHAGGIWLLLPHAVGRSGTETPGTFEVELVNQEAQVKGAPAVQQTQPPPVPQTPPVPQEAKGDLPAPPAPQPQREAPPGPPVTQSSVNLGGSDEDRESLSVTGDNVVPPRPDGLVHNKPPSYPAEAARRHAEGTVGLRVHVTENGTPGWVDIVHSSGDSSLDETARNAVALWRFQPARDHGTAVPFDYQLNVEFKMGDR
jgi:protein TonB